MSSMLLRKRIALLGAVAALGTGLAAGTSVGLAASSDSFAPIQHAVTKSSKASSEKLSFALSITSSDKSLPSGGFSLSGTGSIDNRHKTAQVTVDLGALAAALGGVAGGNVPQKIDVRLVHNTIYAYIPAVAKTVTPGKTWLKLDAKSVASTTKVKVDPQQLQSQLNPTKALATLTKAASVKSLGSATVKGTSTSHYRISIDLAGFVKTLPKDQQAQALKGIQQSGLTSVPVDVYVGKSGYLRRIETKLDVKPGKGTAPISLKATLDLYDYGAKVAVHAPPAGKVADAGKLLSKAVTGLTG